MLPASPKTLFATALIDVLRQVPQLDPYVYPDPYDMTNQQDLITARANQYGGCLAVISQGVTNDKLDPSVRDAYLQGDWGIVGIVHQLAWSQGGSVDPAIRTASDLLDAMLSLVIAAVVAWQPVETPYGCPMIVGEEPVQLTGAGWEQTLVRGIRVRVPLAFPQLSKPLI